MPADALHKTDYAINNETPRESFAYSPCVRPSRGRWVEKESGIRVRIVGGGASEEYIVDSFSGKNPFASVPSYPDSPGKKGFSAYIATLLERKDSLPSRKILDGINPQIEELSKFALQEEGEGQLPLSEDSRHGLLNFLKRVSDSGIEAVPGLALTYEGNIVAEWESSPDEVLSLEFLDSSSLKFVFFYQCSDLADKILRISGSGSVSGFLEDHRRALKFLEGINPDD